METRWDDADMSVADMINEGVRRAYTHADNVLRPSILADPAGLRKNTGDNTPAVIHTEMATRRQGQGSCRGERRRFREQGQNGHAEP